MRPRLRTGLATVVATLLAVPAIAITTPLAAAAAVTTALAPTALRVDGQGIGLPAGEPNPVLSWTVNDSGRAQAQTAYEIKLGSWDSGQVASSTSTGDAYAGPALTSNSTYVWSVRTWNRQGQASPWAASATLDTGLFKAGDWSAWWTQVADGALVRGDFTIAKPVARARLYFAALGIVEPHLNGARVAPTEVLDSSVTDYRSRALYRDLDVTGALVQGQNALAFMAGKGQFSGSPTFVAQLDVAYTDGTTTVFGTDPTWKTFAGPVTGDDFYNGETYDARKAVTGWDTTGFNDSAWALAHTVAPASHPMSLAQGRPVTALDATTCCGWSTGALTDGIDGSTDASQGYHSATATVAASTKWVQTDLGADQAVRQIRLMPARPTNDTSGDVIGAGFPVRYLVQVSDDPTFATATTVADRTGADQPNPGTAPASLAVTATGRYVRVTATKLACVGTSCTFRLAELGIYGASPATVYSALTRLQVDTTPPTTIVTTLTPVHVTSPATGIRVYDFGQNITGWVTITAAQPAGTVATIKKGEILDASGQVTTANISFSSSDPPRQTDHYTFSGSGTETYAPHFNYSGFRYAQLTGVPATATVTVTAVVVHTAVPTTGHFSTSNALLNSIQTAVAQTELNGLQSIPEDCPTREKHGWLGDSGDSDVEAMANFDMQSFYTKWLGDIATSLNANGSIPSVAPANSGQASWATDPAWGTAYPQIIWDDYLQYGSTQPITANYQYVKGWVNYLATIADSDHIIVNSPTSWGDDWVSTVSTPHDYFQTGFYYLDASLLTKMAVVVGNTADAQTYSALATQIAAGFNRRYFTASTGVYGTGTQLSEAMPLVLGIVPAGSEQAVLANLVADLTAHGNHVTTGFVGTTFVFQALGMYGRNDVALAIAERTDYPSFGYMVAGGPGTIWEKWPNSSAADGTSSKDHIGLGGSIGQWFYQQLAGIQPGTAGSGYATMTLAPSVVGDLTSVTAQQQTVRGTVASSWQRSGSTLTYHAVIPVGATASIRLPLLGGAGSTVTENSLTIYSAGASVQSDPGLTVGAATDQNLTMTAGSGDYTFTVTPPTTAFTRLSMTASKPASIVLGGSGDISAVVVGRSTSATSATVGATVPAGWTVTATPAAVPLTPATSDIPVTVHVSVPNTAASGVYPVTVNVRAPDSTVATAAVSVTVSNTTSALPGTWAQCGPESGTCAVSGTQTIAFGAQGQFHYATVTAATTCSTDVFGEPAYGVVKACYIEAAPPTSTIWASCASESATCSFAGAATVAYGAGGHYAYGTFTGGTPCTNAVFGDPAPGAAKTCAFLGAPPTVTTWTACASETGTCAFTGAHEVAYGAAGHYVYRTFTGGTACGNAVFGDPIAGAVKTCYVQ